MSIVLCSLIVKKWHIKQKYVLSDEPVSVKHKIIHCSGEVDEDYDGEEYVVDGLWFNLAIESNDMFDSDICLPDYHLTVNNKMYNTILNLDVKFPFLEIDKLEKQLMLASKIGFDIELKFDQDVQCLNSLNLHKNKKCSLISITNVLNGKC